MNYFSFNLVKLIEWCDAIQAELVLSFFPALSHILH